jgi:solute carrier family 24 (sodium/potassium/calcium exchanger), member 2
VLRASLLNRPPDGRPPAGSSTPRVTRAGAMLGSLARMRRTRAGRKQVRIMRATVFLVAAATMGLVSAHTSALASAARDALGIDHPHERDGGGAGRSLLGELYPPDLFSDSQNKSGFFMLHVVGVLYTFIAIAIICDDFFVPALEVLCDRYEIEDDVAGATFMAAGGSAPELFTSLIGVFIAKSNVGFGTIIGSAVFNVLFVIGACAFFSYEVLELTWWPLARDCTFYVFDLCMLYVFFQDEKIAMWESGLMLFFYVMYVIFMKFNARVETWVKVKVLKQTDFVKEVSRNLGHNENAKHGDGGKPKGNQVSPLPKGKGPVNESAETTRARVPPGPVTESADAAAPQMKRKISRQFSKNIAKPAAAVAADADDDDEGMDLSWPEGKAAQIYYVIAAPLMYLFYYTVPNCKKKTHLFMVVFLESIFYIGFFSYFMVWWATVVGDVLGIDDVVMGYTILAAGTSVPDLLSSVIVARQGLGDMAVSSSIGSNIFDITFGLPLPWLLWSAAHSAKAMTVSSESLGFALTLLIIMIVCIISIIAFCKWRMTKFLGASMVFLYAVFLALVVMEAYDVIDGF